MGIDIADLCRTRVCSPSRFPIAGLPAVGGWCYRFQPFVLLLVLLAPSLAQGAEGTIRLATATSTESSGLLDVLLPSFEKQSGYKVHVIAAGTGKALRIARDGDVDVALVHAYEAEQGFVAEGHGVNRRDVMYNDFIIVGPPNDPAGIKGLRDAAKAMKRIATARSTFLSRGDESGTHTKERELWQAADLKPAGQWYREVGQGQGKTLQMAMELSAYILTDRGTWVAHQTAQDMLSVLVEGDPRLYNRYGVIAVSPAKYPDVNYMGAMRLIAWLTDLPGQALIRDYRIAGQPLFFPLALEP